ncbi:MAG TPA: type II toxin-antitoxin system VapC family toxin [Methanosarcinaceae archaeon]|nr:type II toxin-antitoxin system VapC family toxin [Methanosarcinaceae archaeon]
MSGKDRYLIDTNILIYFLEGEKQALALFERILDDEIYISLINKIEVLSFPDMSKKDDKSIRMFLSSFITLEIDNTIAEEAIRIRKNYKLKLPDALICATSIIQDTILVSRNEKDFLKVKGLKFLNPYQAEMK